MNVKFFSNDAKLPTRASKQSVGLDVYLPKEASLLPNERKASPLDIGLDLPYNTYAQFISRSSIALAHHSS